MLRYTTVGLKHPEGKKKRKWATLKSDVYRKRHKSTARSLFYFYFSDSIVWVCALQTCGLVGWTNTGLFSLTCERYHWWHSNWHGLKDFFKSKGTMNPPPMRGDINIKPVASLSTFWGAISTINRRNPSITYDKAGLSVQ